MSIFDLSDDSVVVTTSYVLEQGMPILDVIHEEDEEGELWQFHCGNGDFSSEHLKLVRLDTIMSLDPSLLEIADLDIGMRATRSEIGGDWVIELMPPEEDEDS